MPSLSLLKKNKPTFKYIFLALSLLLGYSPLINGFLIRVYPQPIVIYITSYLLAIFTILIFSTLFLDIFKLIFFIFKKDIWNQNIINYELFFLILIVVYGSIAIYQGAKDPIVKKQLGLWYRYFGVFIENGKWKRMIRHPILAKGMYLLRFMVGIQYILNKGGRAPGH